MCYNPMTEVIWKRFIDYTVQCVMVDGPLYYIRIDIIVGDRRSEYIIAKTALSQQKQPVSRHEKNDHLISRVHLGLERSRIDLHSFKYFNCFSIISIPRKQRKRPRIRSNTHIFSSIILIICILSMPQMRGNRR